jgi:hypothetical protein
VISPKICETFASFVVVIQGEEGADCIGTVGVAGEAYSTVLAKVSVPVNVGVVVKAFPPRNARINSVSTPNIGLTAILSLQQSQTIAKATANSTNLQRHSALSSDPRQEGTAKVICPVHVATVRQRRMH